MYRQGDVAQCVPYLREVLALRRALLARASTYPLRYPLSPHWPRVCIRQSERRDSSVSRQDWRGRSTDKAATADGLRTQSTSSSVTCFVRAPDSVPRLSARAFAAGGTPGLVDAVT